jgi:hypothetical protein
MLMQIPLPGGEQLIALSDAGVAVILALDLLLIGLGVLGAIWLYKGMAERKAKTDEIEAQADATGENQILELAKTLALVVNADSARVKAMERQAMAVEQLAAATSEQSSLVRQVLERMGHSAAENERIAREVAASSVEAVLRELADIRGRLKGESMLRKLDEAMIEMRTVRALIEGRVPPQIVVAAATVTAEPAPALETRAKAEPADTESGAAKPLPPGAGSSS